MNSERTHHDEEELHGQLLLRRLRLGAMKILVNIDVPELVPAIEFYCAALGLSHNRTLDNDVAELTGGSSVIYLLQNAEGADPGRRLATPRRYCGHWTPVHLDFVVEDIEQAAERVVAAGGIRESECVQWRGSKCITFSDPFGHGFCLIEFADEAYQEGSSRIPSRKQAN